MNYEPRPAYEVKDRSPVYFAEIAGGWSLGLTKGNYRWGV